jgi:cobalamin biosynthesis Mg chelatase CobN
VLCVAANAAATTPPPDPSVQQYVETIPTATGGTPSGSATSGGNASTGGATSGGSASTGGSTSSSSTSATSKATSGSSKPKPATSGTGSQKSDAAPTGRKTTSGRNPVSAAVHASAGLGRTAALAIVLAALALLGAAYVAMRRRRPRRR